MAAPRLPINLTIRAESLRRTATDVSEQLLLTRPTIRCEQLDATRLRSDFPVEATNDEVYFIHAGHGSIRCADDSVVGITVGDVLYVDKGTTRHFVDLSQRFLALRLLLFPRSGKQQPANPG
jgi:mannose-6-phosphate isomerase-like protein (cupin superfamily)